MQAPLIIPKSVSNVHFRFPTPISTSQIIDTIFRDKNTKDSLNLKRHVSFPICFSSRIQSPTFFELTFLFLVFTYPAEINKNASTDKCAVFMTRSEFLCAFVSCQPDSISIRLSKGKIQYILDSLKSSFMNQVRDQISS
jgi:hypothetical protein